MAPYIYMERNGIHIINLYKTAAKLKKQWSFEKIAASGRKILFVATKNKQKTSLLKSKSCKHALHHWKMAWWNANLRAIRKAVKKMATIDKMKKDGTFMTLSKRAFTSRSSSC
jgi:small subunit ribosomal protein S2